MITVYAFDVLLILRHKHRANPRSRADRQVTFEQIEMVEAPKLVENQQQLMTLAAPVRHMGW